MSRVPGSVSTENMRCSDVELSDMEQSAYTSTSSAIISTSRKK